MRERLVGDGCAICNPDLAAEIAREVDRDVTGGTPVLPAEDARPWWVRLLCSLRVRITPGTTLRRPVSYVGVTGRVEF